LSAKNDAFSNHEGHEEHEGILMTFAVNGDCVVEPLAALAATT